LLKKINNLNKYSDVDISSFIESYYTDIYLKESSVRQLSFLDIANNTIDPGTILIVDDELSNLELIEAILLKSNHNVLKAENALDAISILNDNIFKIDVIVLDVVMPNINGIDLLKRIKSNDKAFHIPIIMLSATDDIDSIAETLLLGADDYLIKPINRVLLNARINNALEKKYFHDKELQYQMQIKTEQQKADALLLNILPETISHRLKKGETLIADKIDSATVLFADIVGFTSMSTKMNTKTILMMLNNIFSKFDELLIKYSLEKIKTIGDNYMLAGGVPENSSSHAEDVIQMAIEMLK
jgi:Response regulator containing CheY-like receiver, AAA-type ATPase, and DNA-binding domains